MRIKWKIDYKMRSIKGIVAMEKRVLVRTILAAVFGAKERTFVLPAAELFF